MLAERLRAINACPARPVFPAVDPVDELTMAIRNGSPREALEKLYELKREAGE